MADSIALPQWASVLRDLGSFGALCLLVGWMAWTNHKQDESLVSVMNRQTAIMERYVVAIESQNKLVEQHIAVLQALTAPRP